jgi:KDO2-lipid IV(A) lauroyltransferase
VRTRALSRPSSHARLVGLVYALAWKGVRMLPERVAAELFARGADAAARRRGRACTRLRANLSRVAGPGVDLDALTRAAMRSYARYWLEVFRFEQIGLDRFVGRMRTVDEHRLRDSHAAGGGTVIALPHMGNWDQAGAWVAATGIPFTTVAERLEPASLFDRFVAFRTALGMEVIPLTGGERPPFEVLADRLRAGGLLCLLADRDMTERGVRVRFFSAAAKMPAGPAALALETGATLLPVTLWFDGEGWAVRFHPPVEHTDVETMTQALADAFAEGIAAHPADWHMLARVFVDDVPAPGVVGEPARGRGRAAPAGDGR